VPPVGVAHGLLRVKGSGDDTSISTKNMRVRVVEVDTDGTTGTATSSGTTHRCISDARVTSGLPTGRYNQTGSSTSIPNGTLRTLYDEKHAPGAQLDIPMFDPTTATPITITPGKVIAVGVTPDSGAPGTTNVQLTIQGRNV